MKKIEITEQQRNELCYEIARLLLKFKKDQNVECIYFAPYSEFGDIKGNVLILTIVKQGWSDQASEQQFEAWNRMYQKEYFARKLGFSIYVDVDNAEEFTSFALNPSEVKRNQDLFNSTILFDKTGEYSKMSQRVRDIFISDPYNSPYDFYKNIAVVVPSLVDRIQYETEIRSMEEEIKTLEKI